MRLWGPSWLRQRSSGTRAQTRPQNGAVPSSGLWDYARAFVESTSDCVFFLDRDWRFTFFNSRAVTELHASPDIIGSCIWERFPKTIGTIFEENYRRAVAEGTQQIFEAYFEPLSAWYEVHATPVGSDLMVIFRNITERRVAAEALRIREQQLATVFGQTMVGILHRDLNGRVLMVNQRYCDIVGRSSKELDGLPMQAFTYEEDVDWNTAMFRRHLEKAEPFQIEKRYVRPDGTVTWCAVNVSFVCDEAGKPISTITVAEDIHARKTAEERAYESRNLFQVVIDSIQDLIFVKDREGRFVFSNRSLSEIYGPIEGTVDREFFSSDRTDIHPQSDRQVLATGEPITIDEVIPVKGTPRHFQTVKVPWRRNGEIAGVVGISRDLTERLEAEAELIESKRQLATLIDNLPGLVYQCDIAAPWPFTFISEGAEAVSGYSSGEFMDGKLTWGELIHPDDVHATEETILSCVSKKQVFDVTYRITTRAGETRWVSDRGQCIHDAAGEPLFLEGIISDVTAQKEAEEQILWAAHHDHFTRLPNRTLLQLRLGKALEQAMEKGRKLGLVILDVDHLKEINDTLGHDAGDAALQAIANRLSAAVRPIDTVARNGGDEFAIILPEIDGGQEVKAIMTPILEVLKKPLPYAGRMLECRASIGASIWPDHASEASDLLKQANVALHTAKATGRDKVVVFEPSMRTEAQRKAEMRSNARGAIDARSIEPFYQPKVHLTSGELAGFEALLRWRNPRAGIELPGSIQAAFDDPHLAVALSTQMHDMVFNDMRRWLHEGVDFGHVAINASAAEFREMDFADRILERLRAADIPNRCLEIEVTETVFLGRGAEYIEKALRTLSAEGVKIALDDFGTGYASLSHLKQFPVDIIKIDRSFVNDLASNPDDPAILQAVVGLGKSLGITTVAEGVETAVQAVFLRSQGCDVGQGFLFGMASPSKLIPELVASWNPRRVDMPELDTLFPKDRKRRR
ncbi:GGDEF and EAL domain-containing protein [Microvirga guangxiensis]|uniref:PAS domain S-box-containing protein/diguanylate cyclase (GGDEF) domain-containing protein n=1 Tax=Microvirga guangxiensis TaxID=549386 RepID=A0A1G5KX83_9HYPH|nr:GGDEF and EAL domain-containing protein [Microvirga guangxiensis]SCZ04529.1 PAS domain S-box-containing protein/diguanylate cyclase (GGDEF) domain-containing protein [Microvirga guangxiensis]